MSRPLVTARSTGGMTTASHALAAEAGRAVLAEGGNAVEAAVAMGAVIAVVYPHMNGVGGDAFWLVHVPNDDPVAIQSCGPAGARADRGYYAAHGLTFISSRGPGAANTVPGVVAGWAEALVLAREFGGTMELARLLAPAVAHADGVAAAPSFARMTAACADDLAEVPGFAETFLPGGRAPEEGEIFRQPQLAATLRALAERGLDDFYRGRLAAVMAADLAALDSPVTGDDLAGFRARRVTPLSLRIRRGTLYNMPPPTQGLASLIILGLADRLDLAGADDFGFVHRLVEATKRAFDVRDRVVTDPAHMREDPAAYLAAAGLDGMAAAIDRQRALPWPVGGGTGDTVWFGAADTDGHVVSVIQSVYWEFGSGVVLPKTGVLWQNRGVSFDVDPRGRQPIAPGRLPFHTLNPALARLDDGRVMAYGSMGGDGQPQFQAQLFVRHVMRGMDLQDSVSAPRFLLGRTWGDAPAALRLESRFAPALLDALVAAGHAVERAAPFAEFMGHAGAVVRHADGRFEGASDPRSDGAALGV
jgi:gamma-glutamyltranspeptidase/glutathione hydrolase